MDVGEGCWLLRIEVVSSTSRLLKLEEIDGTVIEVGCHSLFRKSFFTRSFLFGSIVVATDDDRTMTFIILPNNRLIESRFIVAPSIWSYRPCFTWVRHTADSHP